ncbi:single-stranded-DNA-specific exonuclease RecJ [Candidatus Gracilibacteria bacterium]|nr:single-stranded-DNA-specific exonuclease RecJ [Candidatus Gracilibacteria bacterium]
MKITKESIKGNSIIYDTESKNKSIEEILDARFEAGEFILDGSFEDLHDPYQLKDMDKAVDKIKQAHKNKETVMIFGDYDVDGVTSTSILMHFFQTIGLRASYRLPDRVKDGYGMKKYFIDEMKELGVNLVVTVDCGTKDIEVVDHAKDLGIEVIVTDHHAVPDVIPKNAVAVINPKRDDCNYMYKNLAGAGVAFKLVQALAYEFMDEVQAKKYLQNTIDIAAIGTVADCMRLTGENRIIVQAGLKQLKNTRSIGLKTLIADRMDEDLDADIFGFQIGPRLNAAGRMDSPYKAVNLILNNSSSVLKTIKEIENLNELRKEKTKQFTGDALEKVNRQDNLLFYVSKDISHGIIGIVAGRITEQFYKPCIALKDEGDKLVASCRSPEYFSMIELLDKHKDFFLAYGGHKQAAGFSIAKEKFADFRKSMLATVNAQDFSQYKKEIEITQSIRLSDIGFKFLERVNRYKPFGLGNEKPLFLIENFIPEKVEILGNKSRDHIKFTSKYGFKIFAFFMGEHYETLKRNKKPLSLVVDMSEDNWMGNRNIMLKVSDVIIEN